MLDSVLKRENPAGHRRGKFIWASLAVHAAILGIILLIEQHRITPVSSASIPITFANLNPAPLPRSPAGKVKEPKRKVIPRKNKITKKLIAPRETPAKSIVEIAKKESADTQEAADDDEGAQNTVSNNTPPGMVGGVIGGATTGAIDAFPATPRLPPEPMASFQKMEDVRKHRIRGHDPQYPPRAERQGIEGVVLAKVDISASGEVTKVTITQNHPAFDDAVRDAIAGWKFAPYLLNGSAINVFTVFRFTFKLR